MRDSTYAGYNVDMRVHLVPVVGRHALALALGLRQGEALGLRWSDVDLDSGTLVVTAALVARLRRTCGKTHGGY